MNIFRLLAVAAIVASSTGFAEAKQMSSHFYDQRSAQETGITTGRSVGAETQNGSHGAVEQLPPARGPFEVY
ncbi:MAG: hypothetical protein WDN46_15050 [Methylocella sp.]